MMSRVNLVAILLTLGCVARALESSRSVQAERTDGQKGYPVGKKVFKDVQSKIAPQNAPLLRGGHVDRKKVAKVQVPAGVPALPKNDAEGRDHPRRRKRKIDRAMTALLLAYKLKFIALIPTLLGGLILLKGTALLAGFFFALFAAVLGLRTH